MVYIKTPAGQLAFQQRDAALPGRLRAVFLLIDGTRDHEAVLSATQGLGVTTADIQLLLDRKMIAVGKAEKPSDEEPSADAGMSEQERYSAAVRLATSITSKMGLFAGFGLNLAVQKAGNIEELRALLPKIEEATSRDTTRSLRQLLSA
jgi:hypothetical protein